MLHFLPVKLSSVGGQKSYVTSTYDHRITYDDVMVRNGMS